MNEYHLKRIFKIVKDSECELNQEQEKKLKNHLREKIALERTGNRTKKIYELFQKEDKELKEMWNKNFCMKCDYGKPCTCYIAGRILRTRGYDVKDDNDNLVEKIEKPNISTEEIEFRN